MTKSELIQRIAKRFPQLGQQGAEAAVNGMLREMSQALVEGHRIELRGFGAFSVRRREPRVARNPKNGESVQVQQRHAIYFRAGKELRERLNQQPADQDSGSEAPKDSAASAHGSLG